ncbi:MAG TPA: hypothetical protein VII69_13435 [Candidatus Eremiobacteraceae bacterium]
MTEERTEESIDVSSGSLSSFVASREMSEIGIGRRFNVSGLRRVPQKFFPTVAIGAAVIVCAVVIFMIVLGK